MTRSELISLLLSAEDKPQNSIITQRNLPWAENASAAPSAAVLIGLVPEGDAWNILLTRRSEHLRFHGGQISFPGGMVEPEDSNLAATALRETREETGVPENAWQVVRKQPLCRVRNGTLVMPVLAVADSPPVYTPNPDEVAEIFHLPLSHALDIDRYGSRPFTYQGRHMQVPTLPYRHYDIWGATAAMLYQLAESVPHPSRA